MTLRDDLTQMVLESDTRYRRVEIGWPKYEEIVGSLEQYREAFVGGSHITIPELRTRFIAYTEYPVTVGECARAYLRWCYESSEWGRVPPFRPRSSHPWFAKRTPLFVDPVKLGAFSYVDIEHAYWQILRHYRADMVIRIADRSFFDGCVPFLRPAEVDDDRELRHAVGGSLFASRITVYRYGSPKDHRVPSRFANPTLQMLAYDTLSAIAWDIKRHFPLHAWLTDAAIVWDPDGTFGELVTAYLAERWHITSRVVAWGSGEINSPANYRVGSKETRDFLRLREPRAVNQLPRVNVKRLRGWRLKACPKARNGSGSGTAPLPSHGTGRSSLTSV